MWNSFRSALKDDFNIVTVDLLGQGRSGNLGYTHTMEEHAEAVREVLNTLRIDRFTVVGHSMGGYVALALAEMDEHKVARMIMFHSTALPDTEERRTDRERVIKLVQRGKKVYINAVIPSLFAEENSSRLKKEIEEVIGTANAFSQQGIVANIRGMMDRKDRTSILKTGGFPKLIIHGEHDSVIQTQDIQKQASLNENIRLEILEGVGHMGHLEAPEKCIKLISNFSKN